MGRDLAKRDREVHRALVEILDGSRLVAEIGVLPPVGLESFVTFDFADGSRLATRVVSVTMPNGTEVPCADPASLRALKRRLGPQFSITRDQDRAVWVTRNKDPQTDLPLNGGQNGQNGAGNGAQLTS
jgi:hypothetical protein